jgi:hypothetical protein
MKGEYHEEDCRIDVDFVGSRHGIFAGKTDD